MKKIIYLFLILLLASVVAADVNNKDNRIEQMVFGIQRSDFNELGLTDTQKEKINKLLKDYQAKLDKNDQALKSQKIDSKGLQKEIANQINMQNQLYADFKSILTKEQLSKYEKAYFVKLAEQKVYLSRKFAAFESPLELTDEQKNKYRDLINNFNGDLLVLEGNFVKILSSKQKIIYNHLKQRQMDTVMKSGRPANGSEVKTDTSTASSANPNDKNTVQVNNSDGTTTTKTADGKTVIVNNNNGSNPTGAVVASMVVQPILWWSFGAWNPRPIHTHNYYFYDSYWDVYSREWSYWDGYWDGRWDQYWDQEQWRYEEKIYEKGFKDGIDYDDKLYEKWANDPFDEKTGDYLPTIDNKDFDIVDDIYGNAKLDYDLNKYVDTAIEDYESGKVDEWEKEMLSEEQPAIGDYEEVSGGKEHIFDPEQYDDKDDSSDSFDKIDKEDEIINEPSANEDYDTSGVDVTDNIPDPEPSPSYEEDWSGSDFNSSDWSDSSDLGGSYDFDF